MATRFYSLFVLVAWLASMSWLFVAKILPTLQGGDPPDYSSPVATAAEVVTPTMWRISWKDRRIGTAVSQPLRHPTGTAVRYVVKFEHMPLDMMLSEALGMFGPMFFPGRNAAGSQSAHGDSASGTDSAHPFELEILLATEMRFNNRRQFTGFNTIVDLADLPGFLRIRGQVDENQKLVLATRIGASAGMAAKKLRHEVDLPLNAIVNDSFAPRSELKNLYIGQKWTIPVYRPFPPNSPVQIVSAHAERHELILWDGHDVETILVVYHSDAGSGLNAAREPIAKEWVQADGTVLQHELQWSGTTIRFERIPDSIGEQITDYLNNEEYSRMWADD